MGKILYSLKTSIDIEEDWMVGNATRFKYSLCIPREDNIWRKYGKPYIDFVELRKTIENDLQGDVVLQSKSFEKRVFEAKWNDTGNRSFRYYELKFEHEEDAVLLKLKCPTAISPEDIQNLIKESINVI